MKINLFGININEFEYDSLLKRIQDSVENNRQIKIAYINFNLLSMASNDTKLKSNLKKFDIIHPDGIGVNFSLKFIYGKQFRFPKMTGTDFYLKILEYLNTEWRYGIFLLGGADSLSSKHVNNFQNKYPNIKLAGVKTRETVTDENLIHDINESKPSVLMIGLGSPAQENFVSEYYEKLNANVIITVGSGIDFMTGLLKRAPVWMQKANLEWVFRMFTEPTRLWKRYLIGIPLFIIRIIVLKFKTNEKK